MFSEITINVTDMETITSFDWRRGVITHEFGHAWGLGHNFENNNSIMSYYGVEHLYNVQKVDNDAFNNLYK